MFIILLLLSLTHAEIEQCGVASVKCIKDENFTLKWKVWNLNFDFFSSFLKLQVCIFQNRIPKQVYFSDPERFYDGKDVS